MPKANSSTRGRSTTTPPSSSSVSSRAMSMVVPASSSSPSPPTLPPSSSSAVPSSSSSEVSPSPSRATTPIRANAATASAAGPRNRRRSYSPAPSGHQKQYPAAERQQQGVDFIGPSGAVKDLFALPYSSDVGVSVALHNIGGGTLLLDAGDGGGAAVLREEDDKEEERRPRRLPMRGREAGDEGGPRRRGGGGGGGGRRRRRPPPFKGEELNGGRLDIGGANDLIKPEAAGAAAGGGVSDSESDTKESALAMVTAMLSSQHQRRQPPTSAVERIADSEGNDGDPRLELSPAPSTALATFMPRTVSPPSTPDGGGAMTNGAPALTAAAPLGPNRDMQATPIRPTPTPKIDSQTNHAGDSSPDEQTTSSLSGLLPPPEYYASDIVSPPKEPRQYLSWNFHDMNMLVASDAVVYRPGNVPPPPTAKTREAGRPAQAAEAVNLKRRHSPPPAVPRENPQTTVPERQQEPERLPAKKETSPPATSPPAASSLPDPKPSQQDVMSQALVVRVAEASDLRSKLRYHEDMVSRGLFVPDHEYLRQQAKGDGRPYTSYAEALNSSSSKEDCPDEEREGREQLPGSFSAPDLERVQLQTCIVPSSGILSSSGLGGMGFAPAPDLQSARDELGDSTGGGYSSSVSASSSPVCTVLDAYLDNIMANVPQLALCLREKGFIQSVKLLRTEDIPSSMIHSATLGVEGVAPSPSSASPANGNGGPSGNAGSAGGFHQHHSSLPAGEPLFSPQIVDLNATMLLRFLKTNCTRENATYLLRRNAGEANIQLYDITSVSAQRQRKWLWWLAMMSYRFALRLGQLSKSMVPREDAAMKRNFRSRQRSLLQNALDLLEDLADMDGGNHETICAAVNEHLADTFLWREEDEEAGAVDEDENHATDENDDGGGAGGSKPKTVRRSRSHEDRGGGGRNGKDRSGRGTKSSPSPQPSSSSSSRVSGGVSPRPDPVSGAAPPQQQPKPVPTTSASQPYGTVTVDALAKAQDHLASGIRNLWPLLERSKREAAANVRSKERRGQRSSKKQNRPKTKKSSGKVVVVHNDGSSSSSDDDDGPPETTAVVSLEVESITMQLYGLHHKLINVTLRLAEHHLRTYWSSSAMQALRTSAKRIADAVTLIEPLGLLEKRRDAGGGGRAGTTAGSQLPSPFLQSLRYQYAWLWEYCGHFARSFAADELWRERGHACGDDVVSLLREVEAACRSVIREEKGGAPSSNWIGDGVDVSNPAAAPLGEHMGGWVTLQSLNALVSPGDEGETTSNSGHNSNDTAASRPSTDVGFGALAAAEAILKRQKQIQRDRRRVLLAAVVCYSRAIGTFSGLISERDGKGAKEGDSSSPRDKPASAADESILSLLRQRLGDACNEIGKILLTELKKVLSAPPPDDQSRGGGDTKLLAALPLLRSAQLWFEEGLRHFELCNDLRNIALLRCNLCQCCKIRANANFALPDRNGSAAADKNSSGGNASHSETCLQDGADHLQLAHEAMCERDVDPVTWDMVSEELAATFLVLGVRRRQSLLGGGAATPVVAQSLRLSPGKERSIVEPMERALKIYDSLGNRHQAAATHYQLALFFSKVWTCQRDEGRTREKLTEAFGHYRMAHGFFRGAIRGNESTFVLLCLDLSNLYSAVSGETECLAKALSCCLDTSVAFSPDTVQLATEREGGDWLGTMATLASSVEDRVFKLLMNLVRIEKEQCSGRSDVGERYKNMYRVALTAKMAAKMEADRANAAVDSGAVPPKSFLVYNLLTKLQVEMAKE